MLDVLPHFSVTTNIVYLLHSKKGFEKECNVLKAVYVNGIPFFFKKQVYEKGKFHAKILYKRVKDSDSRHYHYVTWKQVRQNMTE